MVQSVELSQDFQQRWQDVSQQLNLEKDKFEELIQRKLQEQSQQHLKELEQIRASYQSGETINFSQFQKQLLDQRDQDLLNREHVLQQ